MQHLIKVYKVLQRIQQPLPGTLRRAPSLCDTGIFYFQTTHGTNGFQPIQRTKQWLSVLLRDTSVMTLEPTLCRSETPELETGDQPQPANLRCITRNKHTILIFITCNGTEWIRVCLRRYWQKLDGSGFLEADSLDAKTGCTTLYDTSPKKMRQRYLDWGLHRAAVAHNLLKDTGHYW